MATDKWAQSVGGHLLIPTYEIFLFNGVIMIGFFRTCHIGKGAFSLSFFFFTFLWIFLESMILTKGHQRNSGDTHKRQIQVQTTEQRSCPFIPGSMSESFGSIASSSVNGRRQLCLSPKARLFRLAGKVPSKWAKEGVPQLIKHIKPSHSQPLS